MRNCKWIVLVFGTAMFSPQILAQTTTATIDISPSTPLTVVTTGLVPDCKWSAGAVVAQIGTIGGNGKPVTFTIAGTTSGDFAINGTFIVVGPNGINPANCGKVETLTIKATQ